MKKIVLISFIFSLFVCSCTNDSFEEINEGYNNLSDVDYNYLVNTGIKALADGEFSVNDWAHLVAYANFAPGQYDHWRGSTPWDGTYLTNKNLLDALQRAEVDETENGRKAEAMVKILRSYIFVRLTDTYGDVPYFEAGYEGKDGINEMPKYDSQKAIYEDCYKNLTEAIETIGDESTVLLGNADFVYNQDLQLWKKFANSQRLRMALRVSYVDKALAETWLSHVLTYDLISSTDESASYARFMDAGYENPRFQSGNRNISAKLVDYLLVHDDPRLPQLATLPATGVYKGLPNGLTFGEDPSFSLLGPEFTRSDRHTPILMYSEVCFNMAELYVRGLSVSADNAKANEWFKKGIESSLKEWSVDEETVTAFMPTVPDLSGDTEDKLEQIGSEKWVAFMDNGHEAYSELRRSGYPVIADRQPDQGPSLGETNGKLPRRFKYPNVEILYNTENYEKAEAATDGDSFLAKVWWDVRELN
ncbi:MAG: SusD/RagB family nutrient-binding outer membrane lipoprotein [Marinilabiliaceae bacterium]|nr:SusD/RagB family nutrient-binding outer membrane lipoprotein [Marinilabiliaceae bacterium]